MNARIENTEEEKGSVKVQATDLSMFYKENVEMPENKKIVASKRMKNPQTGEPLEWEIRALTAERMSVLRTKCMRLMATPGKNQILTQQLDQEKFTAELAASATVFPDLQNAALQDSYGVKDEISLLRAMLMPAEYDNYTMKVSEINGYNPSMDDLVNEAKN
ncbi:MAG TPA: phage portal protein [Ruminococcaceae bacterium]|jgi:hypothetical protein|nr:phage portal protein [Oscillospiraceae bacterium]HCM23923.1 phage portal protein [Oscillospiraceae bacterium]